MTKRKKQFRWTPSPLIYVRTMPKRGIGGRGVFASQDIPEGAVIEQSPVIIVPSKDLYAASKVKTVLGYYAFSWTTGKNAKDAIPFGFISLCNHSYRPNASYNIDRPSRSLFITSLRRIRKGQEITLNYNGDPDCQNPVWFHVNG